jgi:hypothetical protein
MKKIIKILIMMLFFISCNAQTIVNKNTYNQGDNSNKYFKDIDNTYQNFIGTWESTTGNVTFRLILWKETKKPLLNEANSFEDCLLGSFMLIENLNTPNENILCNSIRYFPESNTTTEWVIYAGTSSNVNATGSILDSCANDGNNFLNGQFKMFITNLGSLPLTAQWEVKKARPLLNGESYSIPLNSILIKQ